VLSDHADWPGLMGAIGATGAQRVIVTHGSVAVMVRYLSGQGLQAEAFDTEYGDRSRNPRRRTLHEALHPSCSGELDTTTSTNAKVEALQRYFAAAPAHDAAWAVYFLAGGKPRQVVPLRGCAHWPVRWRASTTGCSKSATRPWATWPRPSPMCCHRTVRRRMWAWPNGWSSACCRCAACPKTRWRSVCAATGAELDAQGRFLLIKLVGGGFRVGVSKLLVQRALAAHAGMDARRVAQRMMGYTDGKVMPSAAKFMRFAQMWSGLEAEMMKIGQPYPFFLAHPLDAAAAAQLEARWARPALAGGMEVRRHPRPDRASAPGRCGSGRAARSW
jgi:hypothetical protein